MVVEAILARFSTSGMSLGALSKQAHQALAIAMNNVGRNFAAGMTGGEAYVFDERGDFHLRCNTELVSLAHPNLFEQEGIRLLIERHHRVTLSPRSRDVLLDWPRASTLFLKVVTQSESVRDEKARAVVANLALAAATSVEWSEVTGQAD